MWLEALICLALNAFGKIINGHKKEKN